MNGALDSTLRELNDCGCCEGLSVQTPLEVTNRPGLSAIVYRIGTHSQFKQSMLAALSDSEKAALSGLNTRDDDDFSIALLDAWAMVADVLTFYQERIANESYLRTATERQSVLELARLIGYELNPGVAASTYLAFTLEEAQGAPGELTIDIGTKVQSLPGPGENPQTFETVEELEARAEWNALKPRQTKLVLPAFGDTHLYLKGVTTNLKSGDPLLIVGQGREADVTSEQWEIRRLAEVETDAENDRTFVRWNEPLGSVIPLVISPQQNPKVYALRQHASLYGYNAPDWETLPIALRVGEPAPQNSPDGTPSFFPGKYVDSQDKWADAKFAAETNTINLDSVYSQVILNSWIVLIIPTYAELYRVKAVAEETKADFNITAKTTRLEISGENIEKFSPRETTVYAQSEELELAETPIEDPVEGNEIILDSVVEGLEDGRILIVKGKRMRVQIGATQKTLYLVSVDDSEETKALEEGDELTLMEPPATIEGDSNNKTWHLLDDVGFEGYATIPTNKVTYVSAAEDDDYVSQLVILKKAELEEDQALTSLELVEPLENVYDRTTVSIFANIALATHGETTSDEVLGSGDASQSYQSFTLSQSPLTYTSADTPSGGESTLEVRVNDIKWEEVPSLYGHGRRQRIYVARLDEAGETTVIFGDGITGARLPSGSENVMATYRKGIGLEGLVDADQLSLLMTRPLGLKSVTNPLATSGAQDPQLLSEAQINAPLTVLTLDRIVSLKDYEDFARSFSGVDKALATWTWNVHTRGVFVTVAGIDGAEVSDDSTLHDNLVSAMQQAGDASIPLQVKSYRQAFFKIAANVKVDSDYLEEDVLTDVEEALRFYFAFEARAFGQPVFLSEVIAIIQDVSGVIAVDVNKLYRSDQTSELNSYLAAEAPKSGDDAKTVKPAELLTLDPEPMDELEVMP